MQWNKTNVTRVARRHFESTLWNYLSPFVDYYIPIIFYYVWAK